MLERRAQWCRAAACRALANLHSHTVPVGNVTIENVKMPHTSLVGSVAMLDDKDVYVCEEAAKALSSMGAHALRYTPRLVDKLAADEANRCSKAEVCIVTAAVEALGALGSDDPDVQGTQGREHSAAIAAAVKLKCLCCDAFSGFRRQRSVMMALAARGAVQHSKDIVEFLKHDDESVRKDAVEALAHLVRNFVTTNATYLEELRHGDNNEEVRETAAGAIEAISEAVSGTARKRPRNA